MVNRLFTSGLAKVLENISYQQVQSTIYGCQFCKFGAREIWASEGNGRCKWPTLKLGIKDLLWTIEQRKWPEGSEKWFIHSMPTETRRKWNRTKIITQICLKSVFHPTRKKSLGLDISPQTYKACFVLYSSIALVISRAKPTNSLLKNLISNGQKNCFTNVVFKLAKLITG